jgi:hypothetical protein
MLEKLTTHQVETVTTLFALADKCARAAEGRVWYFAHQGGPTQMGGSSVAAPGSGKKKNKKNHGLDKPRARAPVTAAAAAGGQNSRGKHPRQQRTDPGYQTPNKDLKGLFHQSDSEFGGTSAAKSCTSCTVAVRSLSPGVTSKPFAGKFSR